MVTMMGTWVPFPSQSCRIARPGMTDIAYSTSNAATASAGTSLVTNAWPMLRVRI